MKIADRYALGTALEQRRFGTLYRATDLRAAAARERADVALWLLPPEFAKPGPALEELRRDLERVSDLVHPNIARVLDVGCDGDHVFVTTELTDGESLCSVLDALRPERLNPSEGDTIVESLGSVLAYAHERGIVHGDVRAENVLIGDDLRITLTNFVQASLVRSTPFAPVVQDDTRALAALAHEIYTGVPPAATLSRSLATAPRRRRKAIAAALSAPPEHGLTVVEFLARAGLACNKRHLHEPPAARSYSRFRGPSAWRLALPALVLVVLGAGVYSTDAISWRPLPMAPTGAPRNEPVEAADATATRSVLPSDAATAGLAAAPETTATTLAVTAPVTPGTAIPSRDPRSSAGTESGPRSSDASPSATSNDRTKQSNDGRVRLAAKSLTVRESQGVAKVVVTRSGNAGKPLNFVWWTSDGTAHAGDDYASFGRRVESFNRGENKHTLFIPLASDTVAEAPETFFVHIDSVPGAEPSIPALTVDIRIIDDDR